MEARFQIESSKQKIGSAIKDYGKNLFSFIRKRVKSKEDAEDILQEVWFQLSKVINIEEIEQLGNWLYRVAGNKIIDKYRKKKIVLTGDLVREEGQDFIEWMDIVLSDPGNQEEELLKELFWKELFEALEELPQNQKEVFVLNEIEHKTLKEIADLKGDKLKTIISRKGYAVKYLRKKLETLYHEIVLK